MKVTEIQIGDWVYDGINYQNLKIAQMYLIPEWCDNFSPIPLTPEILEKNGWVFEEGCDYTTFPVPSKWICNLVPFTLTVDSKSYIMADTLNIHHVHTLQHALRLYGLDELANNFKI